MSSTESIDIGGGIDLHIRRWTAEEPRASLLIVHGFSEHVGRWEHVAEFFVDRSLSVIGYDHRGHGRSGGPRMDLERFEHFLDDLQVMVRHVREIDLPLVVYGHSMGGLIAAAHAESDRDQPDLYVLSAPALDAEIPTVLRFVAKVLVKIAPGIRLRSTVKGEQMSRDPDVGEAYFSDPLVFPNATLRFRDRFLAAMSDVRENVNRIRTPTLVIHGAEDSLAPPAASAPLAGVDGIERRLFPGLRHEMHNEPEGPEVLEFVAGWLEDHLESARQVE